MPTRTILGNRYRTSANAFGQLIGSAPNPAAAFMFGLLNARADESEAEAAAEERRDAISQRAYRAALTRSEEQRFNLAQIKAARAQEAQRILNFQRDLQGQAVDNLNSRNEELTVANLTREYQTLASQSPDDIAGAITFLTSRDLQEQAENRTDRSVNLLGQRLELGILSSQAGIFANMSDAEFARAEAEQANDPQTLQVIRDLREQGLRQRSLLERGGASATPAANPGAPATTTAATPGFNPADRAGRVLPTVSNPTGNATGNGNLFGRIGDFLGIRVTREAEASEPPQGQPERVQERVINPLNTELQNDPNFPFPSGFAPGASLDTLDPNALFGAIGGTVGNQTLGEIDDQRLGESLRNLLNSVNV